MNLLKLFSLVWAFLTFMYRGHAVPIGRTTISPHDPSLLTDEELVQNAGKVELNKLDPNKPPVKEVYPWNKF